MGNIEPKKVNYKDVVRGANQTPGKKTTSKSQHKYITNGILFSHIFFGSARILNISIVEEGNKPKGTQIEYYMEIISQLNYPKRVLTLNEVSDLKLDVSDSQVKITMKSNLTEPIDVTIGLKLEV